MAQLQLKRPICFFDIESTGTDAARDRIVEIAIIKIMPDGTRQTKTKRINPEMPIPPQTTAVHGISDEDVKDAPTFKQAANELKQFIEHCDLGGYNCNRFDIPLLAEEFLRAGIQIDFTHCKMIDVQQIFYKMEKRTLSAAYQFYCNKTLEHAHSAEADTEATYEVLLAQLERYPELSTDVDTLHEFTSGDEIVDYARRMVKIDGVVVFNFGKHKGRSVEQVFKEEPQYYDWMMKSDFALHTKQKISEIIQKMLLKK